MATTYRLRPNQRRRFGILLPPRRILPAPRCDRRAGSWSATRPSAHKGSGVGAQLVDPRCRILAGMRHRLPGSAGVPLRTLIVALLLAGFGLWQGWTCTDGMMTSPMSGTAKPARMITAVAHDAPAGHGGGPVHVASEEQPAPGIPTGLAGLCLSVLASLAAALMPVGSPLRLVELLRHLGESLLRPVPVAVCAPALARMCVSRT